MSGREGGGAVEGSVYPRLGLTIEILGWQTVKVVIKLYHYPTKIIGSNYLNPIQAHPLLNFGPPPEIDFFDVSDDLEQKKKIFFWYKKFFGLGKFFDFFFHFFFMVL